MSASPPTPPRSIPGRLRLSALWVFFVLGAPLSIVSSAYAAGDQFLLVRRSAQVQSIRLSEITDQYVEHLPPDKNWERVPLEECIALLNPGAALKPRSTGMLVLADGQRLPGEAALGAKPLPDTLAWSHPWLGRVDVPIKLIESVLFTADALAPAPGQSDIVLLANGDRQEGFVVALGNPVAVEVDRGGKKQVIEIPLNLVAAITMVTPKQVTTAIRRIWFDEGTVIDVASIGIGADGFVRLTGLSIVSGTQPTRVVLSQIAAILFDPRGMVPLATLPPTRVEGPATRYTLPKPVILDPGAPLGLSRIEFRGPLVVRYALPAQVGAGAGGRHFTTEAELPRESRQWGDYELVIRSNDDEVFRARLNAANPAATINVPLTGRELTIEVTQGANGPVQDQLILTRAMLLSGR